MFKIAITVFIAKNTLFSNKTYLFGLVYNFEKKMQEKLENIIIFKTKLFQTLVI